MSQKYFSSYLLSFYSAALPFAILGALTLRSSVCAAEVIEFPEDELATESVLPVFDKKIVVRERSIKTAGRFELGGGAGLNLVEPLYQQFVYNFTASYYFNELHGVNFSAYFLNTSLSAAGEDLKASRGISVSYDASLAPTVGSMYFANYQIAAYYGKISLTKQTVMNLSLYGLLGVGMVNWSDKNELGLDVGLGQKLYITKNLALRFDLMLAVYKGPDPTNPDGGLLNSSTGAKGSGEFSSTFYSRPFLTGSLVYMF